MNDKEIKAFAVKHAPDLAEKITNLCGKVIEKGLQGILQECCEMQLRRDALATELTSAREAIKVLREALEKYHACFGMLMDGLDESDQAMALPWLKQGRELRKEALTKTEAFK